MAAGAISGHGDPAPGAARKEGRGYISSFGAGRLCAASGCTTVLSRYNDASLCWLHVEHTRARLRGE